MTCDPTIFAAAWARELAASPWFATNAATWTRGPVSLTLDDDGATFHLRLDVHEGNVLALGPCTATEAHAARYRLKAPRATWARVLQGELDPMKAILAGDLHLTGRLGDLAPYVRAAQELARAARAAVKTLDTNAPGG
jgi:putative sterol carrier protein